jgi:hypothetical protein
MEMPKADPYHDACARTRRSQFSAHAGQNVDEGRYCVRADEFADALDQHNHSEQTEKNQISNSDRDLTTHQRVSNRGIDKTPTVNAASPYVMPGVIMPLMPRVLQPLDEHFCCAPSYVQRVLGDEPQSFVRLACVTH